MHPSTTAIHADDPLSPTTDIAPPIHTSTNFAYPRDHTALKPVPIDSDEYLDLSTPLVYSRLTNANVNRLETILAPLVFPRGGGGYEEKNGVGNGVEEGDGEEKMSDVELANHVITYSSGLSAFHAMLVRLNPRVVAIGGGYHGCHGVLAMHKRMTGLKIVDLHDESTWSTLGKGDLIHIETPLNPTGLTLPIHHFSSLAHARGALLSVDSTFGPPGLQDPFAHGADIVMHSGTKYIGGHSDMLCGVLAVRPGTLGNRTLGKDMVRGLREDRVFLGSVMGSLEGWLGVRSLRTMELRVQRQAQSADKIVEWLSSSKDTTVNNVVASVSHASLQAKEEGNAWVKEQMPHGYGPVFAIYMKTPDFARRLPSYLRLFHHATSLGGVESLIEWRRMSDAGVDERLLRVSVGVEHWEDLKQDLLSAFEKLGQDVDQKVVNGKGKEGVQVGQKGGEMPEPGSGAV